MNSVPREMTAYKIEIPKMPLYRTTFERFNFSITPPLKQSADVIFKTDIPFDNENLEAFELALWESMWLQNPHWADSSGPSGLTSGWSSVMGGSKIEPVPEMATLSLAWHITQDGWLKADGTTMTVDPDEAGRFTADQVIALQAQYPGERYSMVTSTLVSEIYGDDGLPRRECALQLHYDEFVIWGYGPRTSASWVEVSKAKSGSGFWSFSFALPAATQYRPDPQEYERKSCWAWRFVFNGMASGETWHTADSKELALEAAKADAVKEMRSTGHRHTLQVLAIKHGLELKDVRDAPVVEPLAQGMEPELAEVGNSDDETRLPSP